MRSFPTPSRNAPIWVAHISADFSFLHILLCISAEFPFKIYKDEVDSSKIYRILNFDQQKYFKNTTYT
jgi:hypothetical protein